MRLYEEDGWLYVRKEESDHNLDWSGFIKVLDDELPFDDVLYYENEEFWAIEPKHRFLYLFKIFIQKRIPSK